VTLAAAVLGQSPASRGGSRRLLASLMSRALGRGRVSCRGQAQRVAIARGTRAEPPAAADGRTDGSARPARRSALARRCADLAEPSGRGLLIATHDTEFARDMPTASIADGLTSF